MSKVGGEEVDVSVASGRGENTAHLLSFPLGYRSGPAAVMEVKRHGSPPACVSSTQNKNRLPQALPREVDRCRRHKAPPLKRERKTKYHLPTLVDARQESTTPRPKLPSSSTRRIGKRLKTTAEGACTPSHCPAIVPRSRFSSGLFNYCFWGWACRQASSSDTLSLSPCHQPPLGPAKYTQQGREKINIEQLQVIVCLTPSCCRADATFHSKGALRRPSPCSPCPSLLSLRPHSDWLSHT